MNKNLFGNDRLGDYPTSPGHRGVVTSIEAAQAIAPKAPTWRDRVLAYIDECGCYGATADEVCAALTCHFRTTPAANFRAAKAGQGGR